MQTNSRWLLVFGCFLLLANPARANIPGGGTGTGANVTITDNGNTVTMANGLASIVITKTSAEIHTINYTYNNNGSPQTVNLLAGGNGGGGGMLYWFQNAGSFIAGPFTETVVANNGNYAEISLSYAAPTNGIMDIHYSMLRGSPGFYTTAILTHRSQDGTIHIELRPNIYAGSTFNWMSVDAARNRLMEVTGGSALGLVGAPVEVSLWTNGIYSGRYEDKYKYTADLAIQKVWGWSSVGTGGKNIGIWNVSSSPEYYPGGPMERSLMEHIGTTILNVFTGGYYGLGTDNNFQNGELWSKAYGPYFYYFNSVTNTLTGTNLPAMMLYSNALAQCVAEQSAWPYAWFTNANYTPAGNRGTVTGQMAISDSGNPNASAAGLWVGVAQQPAVDVSHDFQQWTKPYQFWVQTDTNGNFTIPNVIAGANYTLFAFGTGAAGTFQSQNLTGGNPPLLFKLPAAPFNVTVTAGATNNLGTITWTPARVGATVFEIGYPDRTAQKFRHGDDYWVGDLGPSASAPSPIWSKWLEYPFDFPSGVNYAVGQNRWSTDWNFIQPDVTDGHGNYFPSTSTISFNLPTTPTNGATASLYLGLCSDFDAAVIVSVNGANASSLAGLAASPITAIPSTGYTPPYKGSDSNIREGNNGAFADERLTFSAAALHAGANTITITFRQTGVATPPGYFADHIMYDYLRLELTGYIPPAPANVTAYAGNGCNLVCWPATPGATSYNILRSTTSGSGYVSITNGVTGPVCGSGTNNATYLDASAVNGTTYYYVVQSVNPVGSSASSAQSSGATPSAGLQSTPPLSPNGLTVASAGHHSVMLTWNASVGANYYSVWRSTLANTGGGSSNVLSTVILNNATTGTTFTDTSPTDGSIYSYFVTATSAGGTSGNSLAVPAVPLPTPPIAAPASLGGAFVTTNVALSWTTVSGAVGYVISRATSVNGPFILLQSVTETNYSNIGVVAGTYYYQVTAVNAAGISAKATTMVSPFMVTTLSDSGPGSLRMAVTNVTAGSTVTFASALAGQTILLTSGEIAVGKSFNIDGSTLSPGVAISGNNSGRLFNIGSGGNLTVNSLTLCNAAGGGGDGGAIYSVGTVTLNNCTLTGNATGSGGAIENDANATVMTLNNCTLTGNSSVPLGGGGAIVNRSLLVMNSCTLDNNTSFNGGAIYNDTSGILDDRNCIIAGPSTPNIENLGTINDTSNLVDTADINLAALGDYGGPTQTMPPLPGSPAIDAGATTALTTDQRGYPRVSGGHVDIGSVEVQVAGASYQLPGLILLGNGSTQFSFTNVAGGSFTILATTNLALPFNLWSDLGTATESPAGSGQFQFTDPQATANEQRYYRVRSP